MDIQSPPTKEQREIDDLVKLPLEDLEAHFRLFSCALEKTFQTMSGYAQGATPADTSLQKVTALETEFKEIGEQLNAVLDAIIIRAVFSEHNEQEWHNLTHGVLEDMAFIRAVTSGDDITAEWLAKRDALAAQTASLLNSVSSIEEEIRRWLNKG